MGLRDLFRYRVERYEPQFSSLCAPEYRAITGRKPRPVHLNTWEGIYFKHDPDYIIQMVKNAAKIGVERFIIDDGWFKGRNNDLSSLGDWYIDAENTHRG